MGCFGSAPVEPEEPEASEDEPPPPPKYEEAEAVTKSLHAAAHERLRRLSQLDEATKTPFILIEISAEGHGLGEIEICGKDEYGVYEALDAYFTGEWGCEKLDHGDMTDDTKIPFCQAQYKWTGYQVVEDGMNNMGRAIMQLIDFMAGRLSWTLAVVNSGVLGPTREVREQQLVFKAPHPMNLVAPHLLIELRSAGYIEICADLDEGNGEILDELDEFFNGRFGAERLHGSDFCDRYYKAGDDVFKGSSGSADSNFNLLATLVCDKVVQSPGWSLVSCSCETIGESGEHCEEQLVFRRDQHPLGDSSFIMVVLNGSGNIEVNGKEMRHIYRKLDHFLKKSMQCHYVETMEEDGTKCVRYSWELPDGFDFLAANAELITFFENQGFELQVCTQYMIIEAGELCREQQFFFRPGRTEVGTVEPHLIFELYTGEGSPELYEDPEEPTQVLANQYIRFVPVQESDGSEEVDAAQAEFGDFVVNFLGGTEEGENRYGVNVFMCRGWYENNLAQWTMRLCDFMVDKLGWSFLTCSLCNMGENGQFRKQRLIFRHEGSKRDMPVASVNMQELDPGEWADTEFPEHWKIHAVLEREKVCDMMSCDAEEIGALQQMCDATFRRVLTRDRTPDDDAPDDEEMPYRIEVLHAFRSEHAWLHHRYHQLQQLQDGELEALFEVKTSSAETVLTERLRPGEAYLFHATNPSSAMSILKTGFVLSHAGTNVGAMYGAGVYLAECSSKSDEYGRDDGGNTYPGLLALLVCRCFVGRPLVVSKAGDHVSVAQEEGYDCVCGDRESAVGTYREFVIFNEAQVYPEFTVIYRRQWAREKVPAEMQTETSGTTGRFWQMRGDLFGFRGWRNVPTEVNNLLLKAKKRGLTSKKIRMRGKDYFWDIEAKTVKNDEDESSPLRPPMQS